MRDRESLLLDEVLQVDHEQRTPLGADVVHVPRVTKCVVEGRRGEAVHAVDHDLQRVRQVLRLRCVRQIWPERSSEHRLGVLDITVLDGDASGLDLGEALRVRPEHVQDLDRGRVHRGDIEQSHIAVDARLGVHVTALAGDLAAI